MQAVKRLCPTVARHASSMSRYSLSSVTVRSPQILPAHVPIEEELYRHYNPRVFCPVNPGQVFHNSYKALVKLGFGSHSTVWLAEDLRKYIYLPIQYMSLLSDGF
jgi:hypothetical protein